MVNFSEPKEILGWVLLGLISGLIARRVMPGEEKGGCFVTIGLGVIGAFVGGWIGRHVGFLHPPDPGSGFPPLHSLLTATVGAMVILALWNWIRR
ncbi:GlsB/YeaQ/YmgE family stress response membrane protein [Luteolibacter sp. Populi]|uniref:GlsB/YeaQ/YmgE family stress response membrane protein n=1 Tax=Luteolibacter sp. Populi TaxID=3230487 RepID=UPI003465A8EA